MSTAVADPGQVEGGRVQPGQVEQNLVGEFWNDLNAEGLHSDRVRALEGMRPLDAATMLWHEIETGDASGQWAQGTYLALQTLDFLLDPVGRAFSVLYTWFLEQFGPTHRLLNVGEPQALIATAEAHNARAKERHELHERLTAVAAPRGDWGGSSAAAAMGRGAGLLEKNQVLAVTHEAVAGTASLGAMTLLAGRAMIRDLIASFLAEVTRLALFYFFRWRFLLTGQTVGSLTTKIFGGTGRILTACAEVLEWVARRFAKLSTTIRQHGIGGSAPRSLSAVASAGRTAGRQVHGLAKRSGQALAAKNCSAVARWLDRTKFARFRSSSSFNFELGKVRSPNIAKAGPSTDWLPTPQRIGVPMFGGWIVPTFNWPGDLLKFGIYASREASARTHPPVEAPPENQPSPKEDTQRQEQPDSRADGGEPDTPDAVPDELRDGDTSDDEERDNTDDRNTDNRADGLQNSMRRPPAGVVAPVPAPATPKSPTPPDSSAAFPEMLPPAAMLPRFDDVEVPQPPARYVVRQGDSLSSISAEYVTTPAALYDLNREVIVDPDVIYPGQQLKTR